MPEELLQSIFGAVVGTLVAFEFIAAIRSYLTSRREPRGIGAQSLWLTQPFAIRDHFATRRFQLAALRAQYPILRTRRHGRQIRQAIRQLPSPIIDISAGCVSCRDARLHGRPRCIECGRRLVAPPMEARV
jgi:hypothetical protein